MEHPSIFENPTGKTFESKQSLQKNVTENQVKY